MRKFTLMIILTAAVLFSGCDAFRFLAGRPTSADIEAKRADIEAAEAAALKSKEDSLERVRKMDADSVAALDSLRRSKITVVNSSSMGGLIKGALEHNFYIVIGSFKDRSNAEYMRRKAQDAGCTAELVDFRNGYVAVAVLPSDSIVSAYENLKKVKGESFCPADAWVLVNK